jgi:hypothetical protein
MVSIVYRCGLTLFRSVNVIFEAAYTFSNVNADEAVPAGCPDGLATAALGLREAIWEAFAAPSSCSDPVLANTFRSPYMAKRKSSASVSLPDGLAHRQAARLTASFRSALSHRSGCASNWGNLDS